MAERKVTVDADDRFVERAEPVEPDPAVPDDLPSDAEDSVPDGWTAGDPADLDEATQNGSDDLDAGLDMGLGDGTDRMGEFGERDPIGDMDMPTEVGGAPGAGDPESALVAGRSAAGDDSDEISSETDPTPFPDTSGTPSSGGEKVTLEPAPADAGVSTSMGDEAGVNRGMTPIKPDGGSGASVKAMVGGERSLSFDVGVQNDTAGDAPAVIPAAPSGPILLGLDQIGPGVGEGPAIPSGWDPDDVVDGPDDDLQGDGGYTDPVDDPVGASMDDGPTVDHSIHYDVDPDAVPTDESMLPDTLSGQGGDIDPIEF